MDDKFTLLNLSDDDVLSFSDQTFKFGQLKQRINQSFKRLNENGYSGSFIDIFRDQLPMKAASISWQSTIVNGEILILASPSWQKGKIKINLDLEAVEGKLEIINVRVEFCPDEPKIIPPESPLDDLRQMMNQENA